MFGNNRLCTLYTHSYIQTPQIYIMITKVKFQKQEWYKVVCDNCHSECFNEESDQCLMPDELSADNLANDEGWLKKRMNYNGAAIITHKCLGCQDV